jgi:4-hydroxy-4-methyl-2-oxoglutarate aldolase
MAVANDVVIARAPSVDPDLFAALSQLDLPTFGHLLDEGFVYGLKHLCGPETLVVGRVITVRIPSTDSRILHFATEIARQGDFVVVDNGANTRFASVGGGVALSLASRGVVGIAASGLATDIAELRDSGIAIYASGLAAVTTRISDTPIRGSINVPVGVGGVTVEPGMVALADQSGLLFAPAQELAARLERVKQLLAWEADVMPRVLHGGSLAEEILHPDDLQELRRRSIETDFE